MAEMPGEIVEPMGWKVPFTLGHEVGGWVESWGDGVTGLDKGEPVALISPNSCGACPECDAGFDNICTSGQAGRGYGRDGGLAEYVLLESVRPLVKLQRLEPVTAGPLTDAGSTSYHGFNRVRPKLVKGTSALVIGAGGLGAFAIQYVKLLTDAELIVADVNPVALEKAAELGADYCINSSETDLSKEVSKATGGRGVIAVLDFAGFEQTVASGIACLGRRGSFVLVGSGNGGYAQPLYAALASKAADIYSFQGGTISDTRAVVGLAEQGELENRVEMFRFEEASIQSAYSKLASGELTGRAVIKI